MFFLFTQYQWYKALGAIVAIVISLATIITLSHSSLYYRISFMTNQVRHFHVTSDHAIDNEPTNDRLFYYHAGFELLKQKPLAGFGTGTFNGGDDSHQKPNATLSHYRATVENNYLTLALELGLIGASLMIAYMIALWIVASKLPKDDRAVAKGILIMTLVAAITFPALGTNVLAMLLAGTMGVCFGGLPRDPS
jgi:O-antigen ligase